MLISIRKLLTGKFTDRDKAKMAVGSALRQLKYNTFIKKGLSPEEAKRRSRY